ncbi:hypothetical protein [Dysgonomonas termitidis]|uniref:Uncharacterized protein n=1 Tax=Dysgonomonas termitidis TaxID=1516126 RepID=A0ABV9KQF8_9BACT
MFQNWNLTYTQIPRKLDKENKPVTDWQAVTFQSDYDPYKNPGMV